MTDNITTLMINDDSSPEPETKKSVYISKKLRRKVAKQVEVKITNVVEKSILSAFVAKTSSMNVTVIAGDSPTREI
jgi:hypothetical protein